MKASKFIIMISLLIIGLSAYAGGKVTGKITGYIPYGVGSDGLLFIKLDSSITGAPECNTTQRFTIKGNNPKYRAILAAVIASQVSGEQVRARGKGTCNNWSNSEDLDYICVGTTPC